MRVYFAASSLHLVQSEMRSRWACYFARFRCQAVVCVGQCARAPWQVISAFGGRRFARAALALVCALISSCAGPRHRGSGG